MPPRYANGHISATGDLIHFMFGSRVGFSGTADRTALFPVRTNPRWRPAPSWKNFKWPYLRNGSRSTYIARAHRAVIFAIAQLSCCLCRWHRHGFRLSRPKKLGLTNTNIILGGIQNTPSVPCPLKVGMISGRLNLRLKRTNHHVPTSRHQCLSHSADVNAILRHRNTVESASICDRN